MSQFYRTSVGGTCNEDTYLEICCDMTS